MSQGTANRREINELAEKHRVSRHKADQMLRVMEQENDRLRDMLESYRQAGDALNSARQR